MLKAKVILFALGATLAVPQALAGATPEEDRKEAVEYFKQMFPDVPVEEFVNGQYALNEDRRKQWESMQDFPPYEFAVAEGQEMFETPFANGRTYASCFENDGIGIRQNYPYFDTEKNEVITLELAINAVGKPMVRSRWVGRKALSLQSPPIWHRPLRGSRSISRSRMIPTRRLRTRTAKSSITAAGGS